MALLRTVKRRSGRGDGHDALPEAIDPDLFLALEDLELVAQGVVEGFMEGRHRSPFIGFSVEFDSHREYRPGDDIRHVNWKLWARNDRLYVKQFNADTNLNLHLLLDATGSMTCDHGPSTKWRYVIRAAAALAHLAIKGRDAAGITLLGERVLDHVPPRTHPEQLHHIAASLSATVPSASTGLGAALDEAAKLCRRRSLIVIFSDLFDAEDDVFAGLDQLRYRNHEILVFHVLDPWELALPEDGQYRFVDLETQAETTADVQAIAEPYDKAVHSWLTRLRRGCEDRGIDRVQCTTADPLKEILVDYLAKRVHGM